MNDSRDPLEDVLRRFRPRPVSAATREQVAERLTATRSRLVFVSSIGALAVAMAASLFLAFFLHNESPKRPVHSNEASIVVEQVEPHPVETAAAESEVLAPTLWAYRRAAAVSMDEFGLLLEQHAKELLVSEHRATRARRLGEWEENVLE